MIERAFGALALLFGILGSSALAQTSPSQRLELAPDDQPLRDAFLATQSLTVFLKMAGDPVAVVRSRAPGKQLSASEGRSIAASLRQEQDKITPMIEGMGGTVVAKLQHAINGIKVRATRDQLASMATLPGVVGIKPVLIYKPVNAVSVPFIGAPAVWGGSPAFHGEHIKLAILDTGADYTHANLGGPGTVAAFNDAFANSTKPADPALFGPDAPKVKGGTDLVGDNYNASDPKNNTPHPDPNPLDCNGHGSHVAGTAAGFGVKDDGTTFRGPYDANTPNVKFRIGPGVAPLADVYAVRVFGCVGSTDVVVEAIDWAVEHGMQIISMSLGADFGPEDTADAEASEQAAEAGLIVVAAAGNAGQSVYFLGSPAAGDKTLAAAAMDSTATFPGATLTLNTGPKISAQNNNAGALPSGTLSIFVLPDTAKTGAEGVSLGCAEKEYDPAKITGKLVVALRGVCARVDRAIFGQRHGAAAVVLINNDTTFGVFEGDIFDPRNLDSFLKPDVTAPGVSVLSTAIGTGNLGVRLSGTSMATPHVSGVAALALQSHPDWDAENVRLAIANTADASQLGGFQAKLGGSGLVQPFAATRTSVVARGTRDAGNVSFGVAQFSRDFSGEKEIRVRNLGSSTQTFSTAAIAGAAAVNSPHSVSVSPSTLTLKRGESREVRVRLNVPAATAGSATGNPASGAGGFRQASGLITLSPTTASGNGGTSLAVPYFLIARARSEVEAKFASDDFGPARPSTTAEVRNDSPAVTGSADFYAWGLRGKNRKASTAGLRAVGVQSFDLSTGAPCGASTARCLLVFAVNTFHAWTTPVLNEYDILVDVNGDGHFDLAVVSQGLTSGRVRVVIFDLKTRKQFPACSATVPPPCQSLTFAATAPTNESTTLMPVVAGDLGIKASSPRFTFAAQGFDGFTGAFAVVGPRSRASVPLTIDPTEFAATPALGVMVVGIENFSGRAEANLLRFEREED